jgi:glutamine---fructose-6-phosphate transaminase (isomerizing)
LRLTSQMRKEILEQPQALAETYQNVINSAKQIQELWTSNNCKRIITLARGSSANAANFAQFIFADLAQIQAQPQSVEIAIDFESKLDLTGVLAIAISQSGETKETISALQWAKANGATTLAISNNAGSTLETISDLAISTIAGKEIAVPATKSYTTALMTISTIAAILGNNKTALAELAGVSQAVNEALDKCEFESILNELKNSKTMISCGSGFTENTAIEAALKFRETCYIDAIGISAAELQHGTKALFDEEETLLIFTSGLSQRANAELLVVAQKAVQNSMKPIIFGNMATSNNFHYIYSDETWPALVSVFTLISQAQALVEALAVARGLDPDSPRNLSKVTQLEA